MKTRFINLWDSFHNSFWFVPTFMALIAIGLTFATGSVDAWLAAEKGRELTWFSTTAHAARSTLSSLAGATIALAGVVFSLTVLTLSIAASQFGSRLVRNVMGESIADIVIGQYVGTALFCLLVLRTVRDPDSVQTPFVPHLGTAVGLALGMICIGMLIWFIHHVATAIQAPTIIAAVSNDLNSAIDRLFPERIGERPDNGFDSEMTASDVLAGMGDPQISVPAAGEGYIEGIDGDSLVYFASRFNGLIVLDCKPGDFVSQGQPLARIWIRETADGKLKDEPAEKTAGSDEETENEESLGDEAVKDIVKDVNSVIIVGERRTPRQDVGYAALELVEIATRALSPGINDPFTAMSCIDRLSASLERLAQTEVPENVRRDKDFVPRLVVTNTDGFPEVLHDAFNMIRQYGTSCVAVSIRVLEALTRIARHTTRPVDVDAIFRQAVALQTVYMKEHFADADQQDFEQRYDKLMETIEAARTLHRRDNDEEMSLSDQLSLKKSEAAIRQGGN